ncbi:toxin-antitoxin system YwqK family antitoxin [Fusobacterium simiae]|uniref:toxin-antitoxin system YwqK family antitoxin n=1 Tax=Fusobacterium TaxID=848 RepID=UPI00189C41E2|nr:MULTISPECIES: toxin-antitoxin system YwqK family antitoxin [Fusobacterium]MDC7956332.1 toxin-antitoxin system YwqK family antitoxin [Fusobacterium simiae]
MKTILLFMLKGILFWIVLIFLISTFMAILSALKGVRGYQFYYPNGKVKNRVYLKRRKELVGLEKKYYENGNLKSRVILINGKVNGIMENYYENGKLESRIPFENDEPLGIAEDYYENGNLESKYYIDGLHREHICCWCEDGKENEVVNTYNKIMREVRRK